MEVDKGAVLDKMHRVPLPGERAVQRKAHTCLLPPAGAV